MKLNEIIGMERPEEGADKNKVTKYNAAVFEALRGGLCVNEAINELCEVNSNMFINIAVKNPFWQTYNTVAFDDVVQTAKVEFIDICLNGNFTKWSPAIFYKVTDKLKDSIHNENNNGGFSGLGTGRRTKYRQLVNEDALIRFDSNPEDTLVSVASKAIDHDPEEYLRREMQKAAVDKLFKNCRINQTHKEILWARLGEGISYDSLATRYGMTELNVRKIVSRSKKSLKQIAPALISSSELEDLLPL